MPISELSTDQALSRPLARSIDPARNLADPSLPLRAAPGEVVVGRSCNSLDGSTERIELKVMGETTEPPIFVPNGFEFFEAELCLAGHRRTIQDKLFLGLPSLNFPGFAAFAVE